MFRLVETIYKAKKISFEEINQHWVDNDLSEGKPLPIRTFHKWRQAIEEMFGLIIENENGGQYRYYIERTLFQRNSSKIVLESLQTPRLKLRLLNSKSLQDKQITYVV